MNNIGLPVPAGFTITTDVCVYYSKNNKQYPEGCREQIEEGLKHIENVMGAKMGDPENPLLVSCRSGARASMPGMMDTVLNIGLNDDTVQALAIAADNEQFAWDSYRRFIQMYGEVVMGMESDEHGENPFEVLLEKKREKAGVKIDSELTADHLKELVSEYKAAIKEQLGAEFPTDPHEQIWGAIGGVFDSWDNDRAVVYRRDNNIPHAWGTATNVQAMVYGNMGNDCATGVAFTRSTADGTPGFNGEYLINAQGEDVVAGIRSTKILETELQKDMPDAFEQLQNIGKTLEQHYKEVQDIEFTVQKDKVWMLQTRNAKRTGFAAVRIAVDLVEEGVITPEQALEKTRIPANDLNQLLQPIFDPAAKEAADKEGKFLTKGIEAGPGAATGQIYLTAEKTEQVYNDAPENDKPSLVLVRKETSPDDLRGMRVAKGILTSLGGASSHAALVARQQGKTCVVGAGEIDVNYAAGTITVGDTTLKEGDWISIDGFTGEVFAGKISTKPSEVMEVLLTKTLKPEESEIYQRYEKLMGWVDEHRKLRVRANAEAEHAAEAVAMGAEGVGLCRTEHMFIGEDRLPAVREMILADKEDVESRQKAINKLLEFQRDDFTVLFREMGDRPVTIRLLDPPLHEFLSEAHLKEDPNLAGELAKLVGKDEEFVHRRVEQLHELNPMLGHRGCRLGIVYPEITAMQARAIIEAALTVKAEGINVEPEIMIPLVGFLTEYRNQEAVVREVADSVIKEAGSDLEYLVGTMIEIPRAALCADQIAEGAEFFSFGTNDLTQTCLGISRDDYGGFITDYREMDIVPNDPFQSIDQNGVGRLMKLGVGGGRQTRPDLKIGICGEHGGDPSSVMFCHEIGLNYVSCSPRRIPIARLAAAQAALDSE